MLNVKKPNREKHGYVKRIDYEWYENLMRHWEDAVNSYLTKAS